MTRCSRAVRLAALLVTLGISALAAPASAHAYIYWVAEIPDRQGFTVRHVIARANLDGTGVIEEFIPTGMSQVNGVAASPRHIYWISEAGIGRANLDGTGVNSRFITGLDFFINPSQSNVLDVSANHLYFRTGGAGGSVGRVGLDGMGANQTLITGAVHALAVDANHIYWSGWDPNSFEEVIGRANLDGTGANPSFITGVDTDGGLAVDANHIYWSGSDPNSGEDVIGRANLDGTGVTSRFIVGDFRPRGLAVSARHIYWTSGSIGRANLDGSGVNEEFLDLRGGRNIALSAALAVDGGSPPPLVPGRSVSVAVVRGVVLVRRRGQRRFTRLTREAQIPVGSEVDTRRGEIRLTSAAGPGGATQTANFYDGRFVVRQARARLPVTELALSEPLRCPRGARARAAARSRRLWGKGRGRFRTRGRHAAATVRGTTWLTQDTCTSTTVRVREGTVAVRDFVRRRTVTVQAGRSYTARAP